MTHTSDSDLVARCLAGDRNSFNVLIDRYHAVLLNMVRRMVRNPEDAKDIVQGVFLKAFERLHLFNTNMKFFSWLYRIAVNETINFIESSRVRSHTGVADNSHWHTPESEYNRSELVRQVEGAMMQLDGSARALVVLRHYAELSYRELGFIFDMPEKTIKSRLYGARRSLARHLVRKGVSRFDLTEATG